MSVTRASLLIRLQKGTDTAGWSEFVTIYQPQIARIVRRAGIPGSDVDDAVQDVLVQLVRVIPSFEYCRNRGRFRHWLKRVTLNKVRDRRRRARSRLPLLARPEEVAAEIGAEDSSSADLQMQMLRAALCSVRQRVREQTWSCFSAHLLDGECAKLVARRFGVSENAVYVNSCRVLAKIRAFCNQQEKRGRHDIPALSR